MMMITDFAASEFRTCDSKKHPTGGSIECSCPGTCSCPTKFEEGCRSSSCANLCIKWYKGKLLDARCTDTTTCSCKFQC
ncbi:hypothetical protein ACET3Z_003320 [Daucus carota]